MSRESAQAASHRFQLLEILQKHYAHFEPFLEDVMDFLGFKTTRIQKDIGNFMEFGPQSLMVQAQRSQAKTTIAAAYAVFSLIHRPSTRVLIISAGGGMASDISTLIVRIVMFMPGLECLRPDKQAGDRTSTEGFDIHHSLKGVDKSASVKCLGITANLQGNRADLLLADDVESAANSGTAMQRAKLLDLTRDFSSIVQNGRILWLGTPQTSASIYNTLPSRGVEVRIWPGRYPTQAQRDFYGHRLAPLLAADIAANPELMTGGGLLGDQGKPVDPVLLPEDALQKKELDQGEAFFQLQHMLCTALRDALRHPLKPEKLVTLSLPGSRAPTSVVRAMDASQQDVFTSGDYAFRMTRAHEVSREVLPMRPVMYIDPAAGGANADETAYCIGGELGSNIFVLAVGGIPGGYDPDKLNRLAALAKQFEVQAVVIEKNMGFGAFREVFTPVLRAVSTAAIEDDMVSGQKERRIINTLAPIMGRGALIMDTDTVQQDALACARYSPSQRQSYSLFYQLAHITEERGSLAHDDRLDSLEGLCRYLQSSLQVKEGQITASLRKKAHEDSIRDPRGANRCVSVHELQRQCAPRRRW